MSAGLAAGWSADMAAAVLGRLRALELVAAGLARLPAAEVARLRTDMGALIVSWRRLLTAHAADESGRCPRCRGWLLRRRWPCAVWTTAHYCLITSGAADGDPAAPEGVLVPLHRETGAPHPGRAALSAPVSGPGRGLLVIPRRLGGGAR